MIVSYSPSQSTHTHTHTHTHTDLSLSFASYRSALKLDDIILHYFQMLFMWNEEGVPGEGLMALSGGLIWYPGPQLHVAGPRTN